MDALAQDSQMEAGSVASPIIKGMRQTPLLSVDLTWRGLSAWVKEKSRSCAWYVGAGPLPMRDNKRRKLVLNNVSGIAQSGTLTAVLGPSGAGKTTLLCALANRFSGDILGDIRINGWPVDGDMLRLSTLVPQQTLFIETLTTREHLEFMVGLLYCDRSSEWRSLRVDELLKELGLEPNETISSLSGGERKRLVFASQIVTDPPLLFCDEPTSGLDSHTAHTIISLLEQLAARGRTIICSIHQPPSKVFSAFNHLILLCDGRVAFMGKRQEAEQFFLSIGYQCPPSYNPADFYMQMLAGRRNNRWAHEGHDICDSFAASDLATTLAQTIQRLNDSLLLTSYSNQVDICGRMKRRSVMFGSEWRTQLYWLTWRSWVDSIRNSSVHIIRSVHKVMMAILMALCFAQVQLNQKGIQDIEGALFIFLTENNFPSCYAVLNVFPQEIPIFLRERSNQLYRTDTYYVSKILSLIPGFVIEPFVFIVIAYWIIGLRPEAFAFLLTAAVLILTANVACAYGCLLSTAFDSLDISTTVMIPINQMVMVSAGLYINIKTIPLLLSWMKYVSYMQYGNEALNVLQWHGIENIDCGKIQPGNYSLPCTRTGDQLLLSLGFHSANLYRDIFLLAMMTFGLHFAAFICLWLRGIRAMRQHSVAKDGTRQRFHISSDSQLTAVGLPNRPL